MAQQRLSIDGTTIFDNVDARRVEFSGDIGEDRRDFAVLYDVLEALDGAAPGEAPVAAVRRHQGTIETAAASALARDADQDRVVISENDLR